MSRRSPALLIAIAIAILLVGCGGDDDTSTTSSTTTTRLVTTTTTDPEADPSDPFCGTFERFGEVILLPRNTIEQARARAAQVSAAVAALVQVAPEELDDALVRLSAAAGELEVATNDAATFEDAQAAEESLQTDPEVTAANEAVATWVADNCTTG